MKTDVEISPAEEIERPKLIERRAYVSTSRQDSFMVRLLKDAIEGGLDRHAKAGGKALDVGCGAQPFRSRIERGGMRYISLDTQAQEGVQTDFLCMIDAPLPRELVDAGPFDLILCTEVLEHVADWESAWKNLRALLAPGGKLLITIPFVYPLHEEPYDFYRPTCYAIRHWAQRTGLDIVEQKNLGDAWDVLGTAIAASGPKPASKWPHAWVIATIAQKLRKLAAWFIRTGVLRRWIRVRDHFYLGNYAVLTPSSKQP